MLGFENLTFHFLDPAQPRELRRTRSSRVSPPREVSFNSGEAAARYYLDQLLRPDPRPAMRGVFAGAGNQRVTSQLNLTLDYVTRLDTLCTQTVPGWIRHADILRAIETRQPAEAHQAMQVHIDDSRDKMVKLFSVGGQ